MRIVWTKEEKRALRDCIIDMCYVTPSYSNKGLLQRAQEEVIPYERRQKITDQKVFTYKNMINEARMEAEKHRIKQVQVKPAPAPEPVPVPMEYAKPTIGDLFEQLLEAVVDRVIAKMTVQPVEKTQTLEELSKTFDELYGEWKKTPLQPMQNPMEQLSRLTIRAKPKQPTVLVVGLNGCQMEAIKNHKPNVNFTFVTAEQALSHYTLNKDHTILMTKFINHSVQGKYRKHPNLHYCNGGVSELKHMLQIIFHKETV
jgi:hypothetical protein